MALEDTEHRRQIQEKEIGEEYRPYEPYMESATHGRQIYDVCRSCFLKYTQEGGRIAIFAEKYTFFVRIDIADSGMGIPEEEQSRIFARFYRSPAVSDRPGVGIGLYLARQIVQAQKGYIKVRSVPGEGSVFSIFLHVYPQDIP